MYQAVIEGIEKVAGPLGKAIDAYTKATGASPGYRKMLRDSDALTLRAERALSGDRGRIGRAKLRRTRDGLINHIQDSHKAFRADQAAIRAKYDKKQQIIRDGVADIGQSIKRQSSRDASRRGLAIGAGVGLGLAGVAAYKAYKNRKKKDQEKTAGKLGDAINQYAKVRGRSEAWRQNMRDSEARNLRGVRALVRRDPQGRAIARSQRDLLARNTIKHTNG